MSLFDATSQYVGLDGLKLCSKCRERKPLGGFAPKPALRSGRDSWCGACRAAASRAWRARQRAAQSSR